MTTVLAAGGGPTVVRCGSKASVICPVRALETRPEKRGGGGWVGWRGTVGDAPSPSPLSA